MPVDQGFEHKLIGEILRSTSKLSEHVPIQAKLIVGDVLTLDAHASFVGLIPDLVGYAGRVQCLFEMLNVKPYVLVLNAEILLMQYHR